MLHLFFGDKLYICEPRAADCGQKQYSQRRSQRTLKMGFTFKKFQKEGWGKLELLLLTGTKHIIFFKKVFQLSSVHLAFLVKNGASEGPPAVDTRIQGTKGAVENQQGCFITLGLIGAS